MQMELVSASGGSKGIEEGLVVTACWRCAWCAVVRGLAMDGEVFNAVVTEA